ncbi:phosphoribosyl-ATP pyrophosphohydrolase [Patescibacteria group bacterium]|nr:MAG: phosphoribosyl-ATP pyrophosphohydrolase [Patescibacteria group bacterium]
MKYNKLVRDKIPEIIKAKGGQAVYHIAGSEEYWKKLKEKLLEELGEFFSSESPHDLGDLYEVLNSMRDFKGYDAVELEKIRATKAEDRGGFKEKIILDES